MAIRALRGGQRGARLGRGFAPARSPDGQQGHRSADLRGVGAGGKRFPERRGGKRRLAPSGGEQGAHLECVRFTMAGDHHAEQGVGLRRVTQGPA